MLTARDVLLEMLKSVWVLSLVWCTSAGNGATVPGIPTCWLGSSGFAGSIDLILMAPVFRWCAILRLDPTWL
jgi:hypothetical protein